LTSQQPRALSPGFHQPSVQQPPRRTQQLLAHKYPTQCVKKKKKPTQKHEFSSCSSPVLPTEKHEQHTGNGKESDTTPTRAGAEQPVEEETMQDGGEVLFLDGVGEVVVSIGRSGFSLQHLHPVRSGPVISCPFACS